LFFLSNLTIFRQEVTCRQVVNGPYDKHFVQEQEVVIPDWKKPSLTAKHKELPGVHSVSLDVLPHTVEKDVLADKTATTKFHQAMKKGPAKEAGPGASHN
jgi:hypothetical protein